MLLDVDDQGCGFGGVLGEVDETVVLPHLFQAGICGDVGADVQVRGEDIGVGDEKLAEVFADLRALLRSREDTEHDLWHETQ